ncbi:MAG: hypothetical protein J5I93_01575 [Pirellulaceae bacterium]|nr:hypothetical protein [Pirellulaceae bacterium]
MTKQFSVPPDARARQRMLEGVKSRGYEDEAEREATPVAVKQSSGSAAPAGRQATQQPAEDD